MTNGCRVDKAVGLVLDRDAGRKSAQVPGSCYFSFL